MFGRRITLVLVAAVAVAACGGGASPEATTTPPTSGPAATPTGGGGAGGANLGTLNVDLGGAKYSYPIRVCAFSGKDLGVIAYSDDLAQNAVALAIPGDSSAPSISGFIGGNPWAIPPTDPKWTLNGKSGTFEGVDGISNKQVKGDFACTN
jgi:hypothetical protein